MNTQTKKVLLTAALAGLTFATTGCPSQNAEAAGQCHGVNECKGNGDCGGKDHACAGHNECKGQGWKKMSQEKCQAEGGTYVAPGEKAPENTRSYDENKASENAAPASSTETADHAEDTKPAESSSESADHAAEDTSHAGDSH